MSFHTWHNYGFGFCTDEIITTPERLMALIACAPKYHQLISDNLKNMKNGVPSVDEIIDCDPDASYRLASVLCEVISEAEDVNLVACNDFEGDCYLLFPPSYPWEQNAIERSLTEDAITALFRKYIALLTNEKIELGYEGVENGG